jgi:hypothetical protein
MRFSLPMGILRRGSDARAIFLESRIHQDDKAILERELRSVVFRCVGRVATILIYISHALTLHNACATVIFLRDFL